MNEKELLEKLAEKLAPKKCLIEIEIDEEKGIKRADFGYNDPDFLLYVGFGLTAKAALEDGRTFEEIEEAFKGAIEGVKNADMLQAVQDELKRRHDDSKGGINGLRGRK